ncbi:hypothetical protein INR49_022174 [Caranx melampygus]|nr:hypothetical protein INR49_022174 [Caranx melampygus]
MEAGLQSTSQKVRVGQSERTLGLDEQRPLISGYSSSYHDWLFPRAGSHNEPVKGVGGGGVGG